MTPEEKDEILAELDKRMGDKVLRVMNELSETILLSMPKILTNVMLELGAGKKLTEDFYRENPNLIQHKDVVQSVLQEIEGKNLGKQYGEIVKMAKPVILERIKTLGKMDLTKPSRPTDFSFKSDTGDFGTL
jgi:hypothetical protein